MAVFRVHKSKDFTVMSNHHLRNKELSLKAKGLLTLMLSLPDEWDYSVLGLAALSRDGKDAVMSTLDELKEHGYLSMTMGRDNKGHIEGWTYDVFETPYSGSPLSEEPYAENPNTENPPQLNTNIDSIDLVSTKDINEDSSSRIINNTSNNLSSSPKKLKKGFDLSFVNIAFEDIFNQWLEYKHSRGESYKSQQSLELCYRKLLKFSHNDPHLAQEIIESAIANNYAGFFELKNNNGRSSTTTQQPAGGRCMAAQIADAWKASGAIL